VGCFYIARIHLFQGVFSGSATSSAKTAVDEFDSVLIRNHGGFVPLWKHQFTIEFHHKPGVRLPIVLDQIGDGRSAGYNFF